MLEPRITIALSRQQLTSVLRDKVPTLAFLLECTLVVLHPENHRKTLNGDICRTNYDTTFMTELFHLIPNSEQHLFKATCGFSRPCTTNQ
jgi:hypothetical protein